MYPRQSPTTHTEQLGDEASVYDWARAQVHALNPTAARVWRQCDGATSPEAIAVALAQDLIPEAEAVVDLTLSELARRHLLEAPVDSRAVRPTRTRRWLLGRGVAAAMLPAIYSIVAPSPVEAQSLPPPGAPTLTSVSPNQGFRGTTVAVTLTGTNFIVGGTTVNVASGGVTATNVIVSSATSLTADIESTAAAVLGAHTVTVTTAGGTSGGQAFTIDPPPHGSKVFSYSGSPESGAVPAGVTSILIEAVGAHGGADVSRAAPGGDPGKGGRTVARISVTPGTVLTVRVGGVGESGGSGTTAAGGFNGGGGTTGAGGGGGGGATSVHDGATPLVIAGGGGGGGSVSGGDGAKGGSGGGLTAVNGQTFLGGVGGGGGKQIVGGAGGAAGGTAGTSGTGGTGGNDGAGGRGGGGGGGGYFGGGGGGGGTPGGGGGGGGSSFTAPGATEVLHQQNSSFGSSVTISW